MSIFWIGVALLWTALALFVYDRWWIKPLRDFFVRDLDFHSEHEKELLQLVADLMAAKKKESSDAP